MEFLIFLKSDKLWFIIFQVSIFITYLISLYYDNKKPGVMTRGVESREHLKKSMVIITTIIVSVIFSISSYPQNGKVGLYILDLIICTRLCFYSFWFTNRLIGFKDAFEKREY